jgi:hypothetical protein
LHQALVGTATAACLCLVTGRASATGQDQATSTGKGVVGLGLLGAEVVLVGEAAFGVKPAWMYYAGGGVGAIGGGIAGYYLEGGMDPRLSMFLLAGGMALVIPTTVAVLSATAYEPPANYVEDAPPDEEFFDPPEEHTTTTSAPAPADAALPARHAPTGALALAPGLFDYRLGYLTLSVPQLEIRDLYTQDELHEFGTRQETEVEVRVVSVVF